MTKFTVADFLASYEEICGLSAACKTKLLGSILDSIDPESVNEGDPLANAVLKALLQVPGKGEQADRCFQIMKCVLGTSSPIANRDLTPDMETAPIPVVSDVDLLPKAPKKPKAKSSPNVDLFGDVVPASRPSKVVLSPQKKLATDIFGLLKANEPLSTIDLFDRLGKLPFRVSQAYPSRSGRS